MRKDGKEEDFCGRGEQFIPRRRCGSRHRSLAERKRHSDARNETARARLSLRRSPLSGAGVVSRLGSLIRASIKVALS